jgi:hypothetical protein
MGMSIYATLAHIGIRRFGDRKLVDIFVQGVPPHIDYVGEAWGFLPPPVDPEGETMRAVVFVELGEEKGTARCGQEHPSPLLMMSGKEYEEARFADVIGRLEEALDKRYGHRPIAEIIRPDGTKENVFPPGNESESPDEEPSK